MKGLSYHDARDRFSDLLGYQAMSHETIRQEVLKIGAKEIDDAIENPKDRDISVIFSLASNWNMGDSSGNSTSL
ncbi:MAG TPA: hypothetical protein VK029_02825 [Pseudogracilibacillus sp.]|nr:hypothetical protein [Pseudogracilibacillus sp.]